MNNWITMHWPVPDRDWGRHVYFKAQKTLPQPGDTVFLYEAKYATVEKKRVTTVRRVQGDHRGPDEVLPVGYGGIIGMMTVEGESRPISSDDVVYEYGNLKHFSIIPCRAFREGRLVHADLLNLLGMEPNAPPTSFRLRRISEDQASELLLRLRGATA